MKGIRFIYILIGLIWTTVSAKSIELGRDSLSVSPLWHTLTNYQLSGNGKWGMIYKAYHQNNDTVLIVNTETKEQRTFTTENNIEFVNDFMISIDRKDPTLVKALDLINNKCYIYESINKHSVLKKQHAIIYLDSKINALCIDKLSSNESNTVYKKHNVKDFYINGNQSFILVFEEGSKISILDLEKNKVVATNDFTSDIKNVIWNERQNQVLVIGNNLKLIDWSRQLSLTIFDKDVADKATNVKAKFLDNESIYIQYAVNTGVKNEYSELLDIWNGNDRKLAKKTFLREGNIYEQEVCIFEIESKKLKKIPKQEKLSQPIVLSAEHLLFQDRLKYRDYTTYAPTMDFYIYNTKSDSLFLVADSIENTLNNFSYSLNGNYLAFKKKGVWSIVNTKTNNEFRIPEYIENQGSLIWSNENNIAYMVGCNNLWFIDLERNKVENITNFKDDDLDINILNSKVYKEGILISEINSRNFIEHKFPIILQTVHKKDNRNAIYKIGYRGEIEIIDQTPNRITDVRWSDNQEVISFSKENHNIPKSISVFQKSRHSVLVSNDIPNYLYDWRIQRIIEYSDTMGSDLKGILYYPKDFESNKTYPLITHIYQRQYLSANHFYQPSLANELGFNIGLLTELGYFVFLPDVVISESGPGVSALNCVIEALANVIQEEPCIDIEKIGLIGHSFGGYLTNFIITQTNLFATAVSGAAINDIMWHYYSYNYNYKTPSYWKFENGQYEMNVPFAEDKELYLKNSPIMFVDQVKTPVLSWTGLEDYNVHWEQTREFYVGLKRNQVPHIALFYKKEGHSLINYNSQNDLTVRVLNWFDYYLKENKKTEWIKKGVDYTLY